MGFALFRFFFVLASCIHFRPRTVQVLGWGYDESGRVTAELKMASMPIVSHAKCIWSNPLVFGHVVKDSNYCAGFRNGE